MHDNEYLIFKYVEGDLDEEEKIELLNHIESCTECKEILSQYKSIKGNNRYYYNSVKIPNLPGSNFFKTKIKRNRHNLVIYYSAAAVIIAGFIFLLSIISRKVNSSNYGSKIKEVVINKFYDNKKLPESIRWDISVYSLNKQINIVMDKIDRQPL